MAMRVPYDRQTVNHPSPISRFAHRARVRSSVAMLHRHTAPDGTVLDYGCGPGLIPHELVRTGHRGKVLGYEPFMPVVFDDVTRVSALDDIPSASVDTVSVFETLEHLSDTELNRFIDWTSRALRPGGCIIVSVPVMLGPTVLLKEATRALLFCRPSDYSASELLQAAFLMRSPARSEDRLASHKGFDFRELLVLLSSSFDLRERLTSPFRALPYWLNSQIFFVFANRQL